MQFMRNIMGWLSGPLVAGVGFLLVQNPTGPAWVVPVAYTLITLGLVGTLCEVVYGVWLLVRGSGKEETAPSVSASNHSVAMAGVSGGTININNHYGSSLSPTKQRRPVLSFAMSPDPFAAALHGIVGFDVKNTSEQPVSARASVESLYYADDHQPMYGANLTGAFLQWVMPDGSRQTEVEMRPGETWTLEVLHIWSFNPSFMLTTEQMPAPDGRYGMSLVIDGQTLVLDITVESQRNVSLRIVERDDG